MATCAANTASFSQRSSSLFAGVHSPVPIRGCGRREVVWKSPDTQSPVITPCSLFALQIGNFSSFLSPQMVEQYCRERSNGWDGSLGSCASKYAVSFKLGIALSFKWTVVVLPLHQCSWLTSASVSVLCWHRACCSHAPSLRRLVESGRFYYRRCSETKKRGQTGQWDMFCFWDTCCFM